MANVAITAVSRNDNGITASGTYVGTPSCVLWIDDVAVDYHREVLPTSFSFADGQWSATFSLAGVTDLPPNPTFTVHVSGGGRFQDQEVIS